MPDRRAFCILVSEALDDLREFNFSKYSPLRSINSITNINSDYDILNTSMTRHYQDINANCDNKNNPKNISSKPLKIKKDGNYSRNRPDICESRAYPLSQDQQALSRLRQSKPANTEIDKNNNSLNQFDLEKFRHGSSTAEDKSCAVAAESAAQRLQVGSIVGCRIVLFESPSEFFVVIDSDAIAFDSSLSELSRFYAQKSSRMELSESQMRAIQPGATFAYLRDEDTGLWARVRVLSVKFDSSNLAQSMAYCHCVELGNYFEIELYK